jgi:opacity protein-like surface antigen
MNNFRSILSLGTIAVTMALSIQLPSQAEPKNSNIGLATTFSSFGGGSLIGVSGKFGLADTVSLRPSFYFGNGGNFYEAKITYDFKSDDKNQVRTFIPYVGVGFAGVSAGTFSGYSFEIGAGADYRLSDSITTKAEYNYLTGAGGGLYSVGIGFNF